MAPADTTTTPAEYSSRPPLRRTITLLTARPDGIVSSRSTKAFVSSVTFGNSSAGSTASTCASAFARTRQGNPSQVPQRMHWLRFGFFSSIWIPKGVWKGFKPERAKSSARCCRRGSWLTAGCGYGSLAYGSVGSSPCSPCTWYMRSARV